MKRIAIFVSGSGTNMENLIRKAKAGEIPAEIALVVSDNPEAGALEKAKRYGVPVALIPRKQFASKQEFEAEIIRKVDAAKVDLIVLAGFMRVLSPEFVKHYEKRIVNIHPACLPAFPGAHAIQDAFRAKVKETGVTVHWVTAEVDAGPVILQRKVPIDPQDTLESLEAKVHAVEYEIYPEALKKVLSQKAER